jgi:putative ABC transport system ATP-binding protein
MGSSGSGKSTFMNVLGFLDTPTSGTYSLDGIEGSSLTNDEKSRDQEPKNRIRVPGFNLLPGPRPLKTWNFRFATAAD